MLSFVRQDGDAAELDLLHHLPGCGVPLHQLHTGETGPLEGRQERLLVGPPALYRWETAASTSVGVGNEGIAVSLARRRVPPGAPKC